MAIIKELPGIKIINGLKGKLDFYYWMGIPVCRSWPKSPGKNRNEHVQAQWPAWSYISKAWATLSPELRNLYERQASGTILSGRDLFTRSYLSGAFDYPTGG